MDGLRFISFVCISILLGLPNAPPRLPRPTINISGFVVAAHNSNASLRDEKHSGPEKLQLAQKAQGSLVWAWLLAGCLAAEQTSVPELGIQSSLELRCITLSWQCRQAGFHPIA